MNLTLKVLERDNTEFITLLGELFLKNFKMYFYDEQNILHLKNVTTEQINEIRKLFNTHGLSFCSIPNTIEFDKNTQNSLIEIIPDYPHHNTRRFLGGVKKILDIHSTTVENALANFLTTIHKMSTEYQYPNYELWKLISTINKETRLKISTNPQVEIAVGDIVTCNYGSGLAGEIIGTEICAVVCNKESFGQVFLLPIVKNNLEIKANIAIRVIHGDNITFYNPNYTDGYILLNHGMYLNSLRINNIVGKVSDEVLIQALHELPQFYDFTSYFYKDILDDELPQVDTLDEVIEKTSEVVEEPTEVVTKTKKSTLEELFIETFSKAIELIKNPTYANNSTESRIENFMTSIDMQPEKYTALRYAFITSLNSNQFSYAYIAKKLKLEYGFDKLSQKAIIDLLKSEFNEWLTKYPHFKENYPTIISLTSVLRIFKKHYMEFK